MFKNAKFPIDQSYLIAIDIKIENKRINNWIYFEMNAESIYQARISILFLNNKVESEKYEQCDNIVV